MPSQLITAFNGSRDHYELPLALHEMGLLRTHVGDLYCPDLLADSGLIPAKVRNRHRAGLPSSVVHSDRAALLRQWRLKREGPDPYLQVDRSLSLAAAKIAKRTGCDLFLYSQYAYWAFQSLPDRRRFLYQFHPHAGSIQELLEKDFRVHPEVRWSFENEPDSQPLHRQRREALEEWKMADGVLCASSFTRWSLVHQGCEEQRIKVVPYGIFPQRLRRDLHTVDSRICRFLFIGQGVQRKGLHHLLKAWKLASLKQAELTVVAGRLDPGIQALLDQPGITYLPGVASDVLESLYSQANVFVMPSLVEGFGFVYLEALAAGLHCVGTLNTGLPDLHLPSECVSIVPVGDIERLAETLAICRDNFLHGRMDKTKIRSHVEELTWDKRRIDMRNVIAEMLRTS